MRVAMSIRRGMLARVITGCVMAGLLAIGRTAPALGQASADIAVVVHPAVPVDSLSLAELRRVLLGDREFWAAGLRVSLLIRAPVARERDAAVKTVCQMTEAQFRQHWIGKVFRADTPSGPKIVYSTEMALEQVSRVPGALAFVELPVTAKGVKVLKIDGKSPGQAGYPVKSTGPSDRLQPELFQELLEPRLGPQAAVPGRDAELRHREIVLRVGPFEQIQGMHLVAERRVDHRER